MQRKIFIFLIALIATLTASTRSLELPPFPANLHSDAQRDEFLAMHFWDRLDFADTIRSLDSELIDGAFSYYATILHRTPDSVRTAAVDNLLSRAASVPSAYMFMLETARAHLYSPDSPVFSEDIYLAVLDFVFARGDDSDIDRMIRDDIMRNRPGTPAADFSFATADGGTSSALDSEGRCRTLLVFYDPDCDTCHHLIDRLRKNAALQTAVGASDLRVVLVYIGDDRDLWLRDAASLPDDWTIGIDDCGMVEDADLYVIRNTPSVYLIDRDGTVMLKEPAFDVLVRQLSECASLHSN